VVPGFGWGLSFGYPWYVGSGWPYYDYGYYGGYNGWGGYGYSYPVTGTYVYADTYDPAAVVAQSPIVAEQVVPLTDAAPTLAPEAAAASDFIAQGEDAFKAGQYEQAMRAWQHAMVDDPTNGAVILLMSQALFALGQWDAAANALQGAMQVLPEAEWNGVVAHYAELYPDISVYTNQIRAAEKARDAAPDDPAVRFLLGYHFGYLKYPKQAVRELDKALDIQPQDAGAQKLRDMFAQHAGLPARPAAPPAAGQNAPAAKPPVVNPPTANPPVINPPAGAAPEVKPADPASASEGTEA